MGAGGPKIVVVGAAPDTGNLGVSALSQSLVLGISRVCPDAELTVFDHGLGVRTGSYSEQTAEGDRVVEFRRVGVRMSRRYHRPESLFRVDLALRMGGVGSPAARAILEADVVCDVTGGDSFTDLYGPKRFDSGVIEKRLVLRSGKRLVLAPQTYGPFTDPGRKAVAGEIVRGASAVMSRDAEGFANMRELLGDRFGPTRHLEGVDVAFALPTRKPGTSNGLAEFLESDVRARPLAGLNVSGLIWNDPERARRDYGITADYQGLLKTLARTVIDDGGDLLLVPHVVTPSGHFESDLDACEGLARELASAGVDTSRVTVAPAFDDPQQIKWVVSKTDWFCGTRMHSTIAGLSTGVPTSAVAYSKKTRGVFATCGQAEQVADPRTEQTDTVAEKLIASWRNRDGVAALLAEQLPRVRELSASQLSLIARVARGELDGSGPA